MTKTATCPDCSQLLSTDTDTCTSTDPLRLGDRVHEVKRVPFGAVAERGLIDGE